MTEVRFRDEVLALALVRLYLVNLNSNNRYPPQLTATLKNNLQTKSHAVILFLLAAEDPSSLYCSVDDGLPEFISTSAEELPMRWQAPECLLPVYRYSTASDVWAFGVLMYEVLTYGCLPYRQVESDEEVFQCVSWESAFQSRNQRTSVAHTEH